MPDTINFKGHVLKLCKSMEFADQNMHELLNSYKQLPYKSWANRTLFDMVCILYEHHLNKLGQQQQATEMRTTMQKRRPSFQFLSYASTPGKSANKSS